MYMLLHKPYLVKWSTNGGKGSKMSKKMSTWFMTQIIAFRDVTAKFYDMGLIRILNQNSNTVIYETRLKINFRSVTASVGVVAR